MIYKVFWKVEGNPIQYEKFFVQKTNAEDFQTRLKEASKVLNMQQYLVAGLQEIELDD